MEHLFEHFAGFHRSILTLFFTVLLAVNVDGHARLWEPPSRSTMWRRGYNTTVNINDNELSCGGFTNHWISYSGLCGVCGDPYQQDPRDNEIGGKYYSGIITRTYPVGGTIDVVIGLTANHGGYFEFKLCPIQDPANGESDACFDSHPLEVLNSGTNKYRYLIKNLNLEGDIPLTVRLPQNLECAHCVLRWRYRTGTRWGCDADLSCGNGKGPQEEFYGCADISVANVSRTIYIDPELPVGPHNESLGLNDLGSSVTRSVKVIVDTSRQKSVPTTRYGRLHYTTQPRTTYERSLPTRTLKASEISSKTSWDHSVTRDIFPTGSFSASQWPRKTTQPSGDKHETSLPTWTPTVSPTPRQSLWQKINSHWNPEKTIWQFLEDITTEALIHYYQKNTSITYGRCKPTAHYETNPIVYEFCVYKCSTVLLQCPDTICTCTAEPVAVQSETEHQTSNSPLYNIVKAHNFNKKYIKHFVRKLILQSRLLSEQTSKQPDVDSGLSSDAKLVSVADVHSDRYHIPNLENPSGGEVENHGTVSVESSQTPVKNIQPDLYKSETNKLLASEIQIKDDVKHTKRLIIKPRVMVCKASEEFSRNPYMAKWCNRNCPFGFCPSRVCSCTM